MYIKLFQSKFLLAILSLLFLVNSSFITKPTSSIEPDTRGDLSWLQGNWEGWGYQAGLEQAWSIRFEADPDDKNFSIAYPSLNCKGFWKIDEVSYRRVVFREKIAKGKHTCIPTGIVIITFVDDQHLSYSFFEEFNKKRILNGSATLKRKSS